MPFTLAFNILLLNYIRNIYSNCSLFRRTKRKSKTIIKQKCFYFFAVNEKYHMTYYSNKKRKKVSRVKDEKWARRKRPKTIFRVYLIIMKQCVFWYKTPLISREVSVTISISGSGIGSVAANHCSWEVWIIVVSGRIRIQIRPHSARFPGANAIYLNLSDSNPQRPNNPKYISISSS